MSENQSSKPAPESDYRTAQDSRIGGVDTLLTDSVEQMTIESIPPDVNASTANASTAQPATPHGPDVEGDSTEDSKESWESAPLPGTVELASPVATTTATLDSARENELLTLIHDLNDCNDVLLSRVSQLDTALSESQRALQQVNEQSRVEKNKIAEQLSTEQLTAQQAAQNAQQQVANVVDQLETAEQALQRQQLINETLQSELDNAQERVNQLEHECALNAQQHAEDAQARVQADNTIRDLRSRLQRQQRYTLQFKAALEKSLTVSARSASTSGYSAVGHSAMPTTTRPTSFADLTPTLQSTPHSGVTMPKAQRIMPWAGAAASPFEGIDPHLENLIRGASTPKPAAETASPVAEAHFNQLDLPSSLTNSAAVAETPTDANAEEKLWQDMERVIESTTLPTADPTAEIAATAERPEAPETAIEESAAESTVKEHASVGQEITAAIAETEIVSETASAKTEPKLNWQRQPVSAADALDDVAETLAAPSIPAATKNVESEPLIQALGEKAPSDRAVVIDPYTVPVGQTPAAKVDFTEPSPWGKPLTEKAITQAATNALESLQVTNAANEYRPALEGETSAVTPTVNPLRTQKKIGSMSAVQLPTFEKAKAGSFKR